MNFRKKVESMTASEIVTAMVKGLENPKVKVDMNSFGETVTKTSFFGLITKDVCFGCAATNAVCQIAEKTFTKNNITYPENRAKFLEVNENFLIYFECAIDELRKGNLNAYNTDAKLAGIALIPNDVIYKYNKPGSLAHLPYLTSNYNKGELKAYKELARTLKTT